ncbi:MAG: zinc ribbon domain-containing protein, partial [Thermoleophilaceae bacterium]
MPDSTETTANSTHLGTEAGDLSARPRARERGRMRRRLRTQKRIREALLLDLGALVYELHRQGRREPALLQAKAAELTAVDQEVRGLAEALDADMGMLAVVATGVAGTCENCGSLLSTDSRYCSACGSPAVPALPGNARATGAPHPPPLVVGAAPADPAADLPVHDGASPPEDAVGAGDQPAAQAHTAALPFATDANPDADDEPTPVVEDEEVTEGDARLSDEPHAEDVPSPEPPSPDEESVADEGEAAVPEAPLHPDEGPEPAPW